MVRKALAAAATACPSTSGMAATWNTFITVGGDRYIEFFDVDTVVKAGDTVTIWEKSFYDTQVVRPDGNYSFAARTVYNCKAHTYLIKTESLYDRSGNFIRTVTHPATETPTEVVPGTNGQTLLKVVCASDFPRGTNTAIYQPTAKNDPSDAAAAFYDYLRAQKNDPAPK